MCARMCMCSVMSSCVQPRGLWHTSLLCPQDSPGKNTGGGCRFLFLLCEPHLSVKLSVCRGSAWQNAFCVFWEQEVTIVGPSFFPLVLNREMQFLGHHPLQTLLYQEGSVSGCSGFCVSFEGGRGSAGDVTSLTSSSSCLW